jgi:predicted Zn-dependent protease
MFLRTLREFFASMEHDLGCIPTFPLVHLGMPGHIPRTNQEEAFYEELEHVPGDIIIGVTDEGFYDRGIARFVFGSGRNGIGTLSTYRFRKETSGNSIFLERMGKELIKILAMACGLSSCPDPGCIVVYHRTMEDMDRNRYVCTTCRGRIAKALRAVMRDDDGRI